MGRGPQLKGSSLAGLRAPWSDPMAKSWWGLSVVGAAFMLHASPLVPDSEMSPMPYVAAAESGRCFFKMSPDPEHPSEREFGFGYAYKAGLQLADELLWRTEGWYAFEVFLSDDGRYLVRLGNAPRGLEPSREHLAVAFYDRGVLLKSYSTDELIRDKSQVHHSASHYAYKLGGSEGAHLSREPGGPTHLVLTTIDLIRYTFDVATGDILEQEPVK
jgi:hypothetical protein